MRSRHVLESFNDHTRIFDTGRRFSAYISDCCDGATIPDLHLQTLGLKERKAHIPSTIDTFHRHHMSTVHWQIAQAIYSIYVQYPSHLGAALAVMTPTSISSPTRCITIHGRPWTWTWRLGDRTTLTHAAWAFRMISPVSLMY